MTMLTLFLGPIGDVVNPIEGLLILNPGWGPTIDGLSWIDSLISSSFARAELLDIPNSFLVIALIFLINVSKFINEIQLFLKKQQLL